MSLEDAINRLRIFAFGAIPKNTPCNDAGRNGVAFPGLSEYLASKGLVALVDQGVISVANFATGLIIGRTCTKEQFGLYMLGFTILTFAMNFQGALISTPYTIHIPCFKDDERSLYNGSTLVHQLGLSIMFVALLIVSSIFFSLGVGPPGMLEVIRALVLSISFILLWDYARRICMAVFKMRAALLLDCCVAGCQIGALFLLAHFNQLSAAVAYWVLGGSCGICTLCWLFFMRHDFSVSLSKSVFHLRQNYSAGRWIFASGLLWVLVTSLYPWLLAAFYGTSSTGVWAACGGVVAICNPFLIGLQNSFGPRLSHAFADGKMDSLRSCSMETLALFGMAMAPICLALLFLGGPLVEMVYGSKYAGNGLIVSLMALNLLVLALTFSPSRALFTIGRADVDFKINILMLISLLTFGILLVKSFGIVGAATGLLLSNSICTIVRYWAFSRLVRSST